MAYRLLVLAGLVALLVGVVFLASSAYMYVMYDSFFQWNRWDPTVEALYFSIQTITTVGYGNWNPPDNNIKLLQVKAISLPAMVLGAAFFTAAVAVGTDLLLR